MQSKVTLMLVTVTPSCLALTLGIKGMVGVYGKTIREIEKPINIKFWVVVTSGGKRTGNTFGNSKGT